MEPTAIKGTPKIYLAGSGSSVKKKSPRRKTTTQIARRRALRTTARKAIKRWWKMVWDTPYYTMKKTDDHR